MWFPIIRSLIFGHSLPSDESKKILYLSKIANHFDFGSDYILIEVDHIIRSVHVINVKVFRDALIEYGYLEEDLYVSDRYRRLK